MKSFEEFAAFIKERRCQHPNGALLMSNTRVRQEDDKIVIRYGGRDIITHYADGALMLYPTGCSTGGMIAVADRINRFCPYQLYNAGDDGWLLYIGPARHAKGNTPARWRRTFQLHWVSHVVIEGDQRCNPYPLYDYEDHGPQKSMHVIKRELQAQKLCQRRATARNQQLAEKYGRWLEQHGLIDVAVPKWLARYHKDLIQAAQKRTERRIYKKLAAAASIPTHERLHRVIDLE